MRAFSTKMRAGALACVCLLALTATPAATYQRRKTSRKYKIFCVARVIEIEAKTLNEMKEADAEREVCELTAEEFENLYQAREAAKQFGGAGEPCECRK